MANEAGHSSDSIAFLDRELNSFVEKTGFGKYLRVCWTPKPDSALDGEVRDNVIWIYCQSKDKALLTLRHELTDYLVAEAIRPYQGLVNCLIKHMQERAYSEKEKVVEALLRLME